MVKLQTKAIQKYQKSKSKASIVPTPSGIPTKTYSSNSLPLNPYGKNDAVLLVGEGNFSFSLSLLNSGHCAVQMIATSFDSEKICLVKYPEAEQTVQELRSRGVKVLFDVDAGDLQKCKELKGKKFNNITFNFPHLGLGEKDQARSVMQHQILLSRFFASSAPLLCREGESVLAKPAPKLTKKEKAAKLRASSSKAPHRQITPDLDDDEEEAPEDAEDINMLASAVGQFEQANFHTLPKRGTVIVTLRLALPYNLWNLTKLAKSPLKEIPIVYLPKGQTKLTPTIYGLQRSFAFSPAFWPGYAHRRTVGFNGADNEDLGKGSDGCRSWIFQPA